MPSVKNALYGHRRQNTGCRDATPSGVLGGGTSSVNRTRRRGEAARARPPSRLRIARIGASAGRPTCSARSFAARASSVRRRGATSERRSHPRAHTRVYGQMGPASRESDSLVGTRAGLACPFHGERRCERRAVRPRRPARDAGPRDAAASDAVASLERRAGPRMKRDRGRSAGEFVVGPERDLSSRGWDERELAR